MQCTCVCKRVSYHQLMKVCLARQWLEEMWSITLSLERLAEVKALFKLIGTQQSIFLVKVLRGHYVE